ncbi:MAG: hypothetical protein J7K75_03970 [Desulfuromonas sp.]|nr:hypothetical protein [Desulfuromonas sp.]
MSWKTTAPVSVSVSVSVSVTASDNVPLRPSGHAARCRPHHPIQVYIVAL